MNPASPSRNGSFSSLLSLTRLTPARLDPPDVQQGRMPGDLEFWCSPGVVVTGHCPRDSLYSTDAAGTPACGPMVRTFELSMQSFCSGPRWSIITRTAGANFLPAPHGNPPRPGVNAGVRPSDKIPYLDRLIWARYRLRGLWKAERQGYMAALVHSVLKMVCQLRHGIGPGPALPSDATAADGRNIAADAVPHSSAPPQCGFRLTQLTNDRKLVSP